ncbi:hypothetical protein RND81_02G026400 [Saponaria officinalis]|uniref:SWIM-type domain-containing protein n=1 Tax=Saponaria officinalis TaxID=3572 RepID=A0AAW1MQP6_SAPOF
MRKKETCPFYFDFQVDEHGRLSRLLFGDMLSVDSTFRTNRYNMVFVPFTGVDHHKRCVTFGADQDPAMKIAIAKVLPETNHRLCIWHIMKKLREKVDAYLWQDEDFKKRLNSCVWNNHLKVVEFEEEWANIMVEYGLVDNNWFSHLFDIRDQWIPAFFKDIFMGGLMRVTSRSESENSFFDRLVTPHVTLVEFWMCFESAMDAQRHKQSKLNSDNKSSLPQLKTPLALEVHASEIYTHNVFKDFQDELCVALYKCGMVEMSKNVDFEVYIVNDSMREAKTWDVSFTPNNNIITCTCCMFQKLGLLCRHALWVFKNKNMKRIPEKYIVHRWTKAAMNKPVFDKKWRLLDPCVTLNDTQKLTAKLWEEVYSCVSVVEDNDEDMNYLIQKLGEIKLDAKEMEKYVGCTIPTTVTIQPPKRSKNKGSGKRIESEVQKALEQHTKKPRYCKICGGRGHDSRNCKGNTEEKGMFIWIFL